MAQLTKHIMIIAGEASGDMHAADLVLALKQLNPSLRFSGLGGQKMSEAGVEIYEDLTKLAVIGVIEVFRHFKELKRIFYRVLSLIKTQQPDAVIFVDYPGFNLRLAKQVKKLGIKTIYYISPQIWAWKKNRIFFIKKYIDKMMVLFNFEKDFYARYGMEVACVGNPLVDTVHPQKDKNVFRREHGLTANTFTIGLLPGSREREIRTLLPLFLKSAALLNHLFPRLQFLFAQARTVTDKMIEPFLPEIQKLNVKIIKDETHDAVNVSDFCLVASGTATLEVGLLGKPMVIVYKTNVLTWLMARIVVKIKNIGLINIVAKRRIVPELLQFNATPEKISQVVTDLITNEIRLAGIRANLREVQNALIGSDHSQNAARVVLKTIGH